MPFKTVNGLNEIEIDLLLQAKASFVIVGLRGQFTKSVLKVEKQIENLGLKCRVVSDLKGAAAKAGALGVLASVVSLSALPLLAISAVAFTGHKLATYNPDYEIVKDYVNKRIVVNYKNKQDDKK
ncbi:hypothetical protein [Pseudomonas sp.]|uniref:hypothetical protein n=1 Tax=Pseudomonas sp. TaxID=306 RepID=UPI003FD7A86E